MFLLLVLVLKVFSGKRDCPKGNSLYGLCQPWVPFFFLSLSFQANFFSFNSRTNLACCLSICPSFHLPICLSVCLSASSFVRSLVFLSNSISISCLFRCFQEDTKNEVKNRYVLNSFYMYILGPELGLQVGACCLTAPTDRDMIYVQYAR